MDNRIVRLFFCIFASFAAGSAVEYLEVTKCYGGFFTEALCPLGLTITVQGAVFGVSKCNLEAKECCPEPTDCVLDVEQADAAYFKTIEDACNGRRKCGNNLRADWVGARTCDPLVPTTDYVTMFYSCSASSEGTVPILPTTTVPSLLTTRPTQHPPYPDFSSDESLATPFPEKNNRISNGTLAGIIIGSLLALLFIAVVALFFIRTKEPGWADKFNNGIDEIKQKNNMKYITSGGSHTTPEGKMSIATDGVLNPSFTTGSESPRYIQPPQSPPSNSTYYTGAEVVKTPQQAINMMDNYYNDEEDMYDVIDDVIARVTSSTGSKKKPLQPQNSSEKPALKPPVSKKPDKRKHLRPLPSNGIERVSINDQIYYSPFNTGEMPTRDEEDMYYNADDIVSNASCDNDKNYQGLSVHGGSHSYETMGPSPQPGRSLVSGQTTYSLVTDPDHDLYYSDVIDPVQDLNQGDENTYSDVEL